MKRVRCPKCDNFIYFDENKYSAGQSLVFACQDCGKEFSIKLGKSKLQSTRKDEALNEDELEAPFGYIMVIENVFGFKQLIPLQLGENVIGRRCKGTEINTPIETGDMSVDRIHCIVNVAKDKNDQLKFTIWDNDSMTGTFIGHIELQPKEKRVVEHETVVTIGATTFILLEKK